MEFKFTSNRLTVDQAWSPAPNHALFHQVGIRNVQPLFCILPRSLKPQCYEMITRANVCLMPYERVYLSVRTSYPACAIPPQVFPTVSTVVSLSCVSLCSSWGPRRSFRPSITTLLASGQRCSAISRRGYQKVAVQYQLSSRLLSTVHLVRVSEFGLDCEMNRVLISFWKHQ